MKPLSISILFKLIVAFLGVPIFALKPTDNHQWTCVFFVVFIAQSVICFGSQLKANWAHKWRKTLRTHQEYISDLKVGMPAVAILLAIEHAALRMSYSSFEIGCSLFLISHLIMVVVFSVYVIEATNEATFPSLSSWIEFPVVLLPHVYGGWRGYEMNLMNEIFHGIYVYLILAFALDTYIVYYRSKEIKIEQKLNGKSYLITHEGAKRKRVAPEDPNKNTIGETKGLQRIYKIEIHPCDLRRIPDDKLRLIP